MIPSAIVRASRALRSVALVVALAAAIPAMAQEAAPVPPAEAVPPAAGAPAAATAAPTAIEEVLTANAALIEASSRRTVEPAIAALADSGLPEAAAVLRRWRDRELTLRKSDSRFFLAETADRRSYTLRHVATGDVVGTADRADLKEIRPNSGIQALIDAAMVRFELTDPDPAKRRASLAALLRQPSADQYAILRDAAVTEADPALKAEMDRAVRVLAARFAATEAERIAAVASFADDMSVEARATLNPLLAATRKVSAGAPPPGDNVAATLTPGAEGFPLTDAWAMLVDAGMATPIVTAAARDAALVANAADGQVAGVPLSSLNSREARDAAYDRLAATGAVPATRTETELSEVLAAHTFYDAFVEPKPITDAAQETVSAIDNTVALYGALDLVLDALSLASIYALAAIGLAITFGVMGVINMAHGEFIMMGAYTGYVVQQYIAQKTLSLVVALPLAFCVTFAAGVILERLVIRHLYHRPLETLLATFGVSIALQQLAKNIFGTQARPLTSPDWLGGQWVLNDIVAISYIRIAIFVLSLVFLFGLLLVLNRTRLGLEVRAVTQNRRMAASMGINPDRINMLTFGLGSGIAGIAGVAIGLLAQVTSELGQQYIVQSFMTVVVGGVGNVWGTLAGATLIGFLQKFIEWFNPSNTLAAQTYMIVFIIIFIQFRPRGIFALRGRAAEA